jgi:hypothetical protein
MAELEGAISSEREKIRQLRRKCQTDLKFLVTKIMGMPRWSDSLHNALVETVNSPGDRKLILLPRGHQKSTIITVAWVIQQLLIDPNVRIQIISATWKLSKDLLHQIKGILQQSALKEIFGEFCTSQTRWTTEFIDIGQRTLLTKDPTISTGGIDTGKTGSHCDLLVFDDPVSPENTTTADQINKVSESFRDCLPLLDPGGRIIVIGTRYAMNDLYGQILENESRSINGVALETIEQRKEWRNLLYAKNNSKTA